MIASSADSEFSSFSFSLFFFFFLFDISGLDVPSLPQKASL
jgi:hypothetical protein